MTAAADPPQRPIDSTDGLNVSQTAHRQNPSVTFKRMQLSTSGIHMELRSMQTFTPSITSTTDEIQTMAARSHLPIKMCRNDYWLLQLHGDERARSISGKIPDPTTAERQLDGK